MDPLLNNINSGNKDYSGETFHAEDEATVVNATEKTPITTKEVREGTGNSQVDTITADDEATINSIRTNMLTLIKQKGECRESVSSAGILSSLDRLRLSKTSAVKLENVTQMSRSLISPRLFETKSNKTKHHNNWCSKNNSKMKEQSSSSKRGGLASSIRKKIGRKKATGISAAQPQRPESPGSTGPTMTQSTLQSHSDLSLSDNSNISLGGKRSKKDPDPVLSYWGQVSNFKSVGSFDSIGETSGCSDSVLSMTSSLRAATTTKIPQRNSSRIYRASRPFVDQSLHTMGPVLNNIDSREKDGNVGTVVFEDSRDETIVKDDKDSDEKASNGGSIIFEDESVVKDNESNAGPQPGFLFVCGDFGFNSLGKL